MAPWFLLVLFIAKVFDDALGTAKTIFIQRNKSILAGLVLSLSNFIYLSITKNVITSDSPLALGVVAVASGVGCCLAVAFNNKFSKDKTYVNVIMSDNKEEMKLLRDFLLEHKITNVANESYTRDWERKTLTITAYAETKSQSRLIDRYIETNDTKFKRIVQDELVPRQ